VGGSEWGCGMRHVKSGTGGGATVVMLHSSVNCYEVANCNHKPCTGTNVTDIDSNAVDVRFHGNTSLETPEKESLYIGTCLAVVNVDSLTPSSML
jgi:hypothetical protein